MKYITIEKLNTFAVKLWAKISATFVRRESGKALSSNDYTSTEKNKLSTLSNYTHPTATEYASGIYKIAVNNLGHIVSANVITKADITALGIPGQDTNTVYTHPTHASQVSGIYKITVDPLGHIAATAPIVKADIVALGIPDQDTNTVYTHPSATAYASGIYKIIVNSLGHVTSAIAVTKSDIVALGMPAQDTNTTYELATAASNGIMSSIDKARLDELVDISGEGFYKHPAYTAQAAGLYKITVDSLGHISAVVSVAKADITALGIPAQDTNTIYTHPSATAYASGIYKITVNNLGHVTTATAITKTDITSLGIPAQDTNTIYTHPNSGATAGTFKSVTINAQGHATGGTNPTTLSGYGITDAAQKTHGHAWGDVSGKPNAFAPASHSHTVANVTDLEVATDAEIDSIIANTFV